LKPWAQGSAMETSAYEGACDEDVDSIEVVIEEGVDAEDGLGDPALHTTTQGGQPSCRARVNAAPRKVCWKLVAWTKGGGNVTRRGDTAAARYLIGGMRMLRTCLA
jgi:hypothetical protein